MSRTPKNDLFVLIKALTQTEKRYVKQELRKHQLGEGNQSEMLFDALVAQANSADPKYNEEKIKTDYSDEGFVQRLSEAKRELMNIVLRSMRQYHASRNVYRRALCTLLDVEFLKLRGLSALAEQRIAQTISEAQLLENNALDALLLNAHRETLRMQDKLPVPSSSSQDDQLVLAAQRLQESAAVEGLADRMDHLVAMYGRSPTSVASAIASDIIKAGELLFPLTSASSQNSWLRLLSKKALFIDNDADTSLRYDRSRLDVLERNEHYKRVNSHHWVNLTSSVALRLIITGKLSEARTLCLRLKEYWVKQQKVLSVHNRQSIASTIVNLEIQLALQSNEFEVFAAGIHSTDAILAHIQLPAFYETNIVCQFNIALILFGLHKHRTCLQRLFLIDEFPETLRTEVQAARRLLAILCHFELDHETVVTSLIRTERRRYKDSSVPADVEVFLKTISKALTLPPGKKLQKLFQDATEALQAQDAKAGEPVTTLIAFDAWLCARLKKQTWRSVVAQAPE